MHGFCQMDEHHNRFLSLINDNLKVTLNVYTTSDSEMIILSSGYFYAMVGVELEKEN